MIEREWACQVAAGLYIKSVPIYTINFKYYTLSFPILFYEY